MKKFLVKSIGLFILVSLLSCDGVFILDPIDPRLPMYTHKGNNVAGAFINGKPWKSVVLWGIPHPQNEPHFTRYPNDTLKISFYGVLDKKTHSLEFVLVGYGINTVEDLIKLKGAKITLDGNINSGKVKGFEVECDLKASGIGQFYAKDISVAKSGSIIFSGTFGFVTEDDSCMVNEVTYGRFDYIVNSSDFTPITE